MDLIQALKKADGKPVRNSSFADNCCIQCDKAIEGKILLMPYGNSWSPLIGQLFADDWYVVESLDDVIEREAFIAARDVFTESHHGRKQTVELAIRRVLDWQAENGK